MSTDQNLQPLPAEDYQAHPDVRHKNSQRRGGPQECFFCGRPMTDAATAKGWWVHLRTDGFFVAASADVTEKDDQGWFPVGSECAKTIPLTHRSKFAAVSA